MTGGQQRQRAGCDPRALSAGQLLAVAADQLAGQRPATLRPERRVRRVAQLAQAVARSALLAAAVHLDHGRVQIDRHRLAALTPNRAVKLFTNACRGALDPLAMHAPEVLGALQRRRRRRRLANHPQSATRLIGANLLQIGEELAAHKLRLGDRDNQLPRREPPPPDLHRPRPALDRQLRIDQLHQPQPACQLAGHRQPRIPDKRRIVLADRDPSAPPATANGRHPQGDLPSLALAGFSTPPELHTDQTESPVFAGLFAVRVSGQPPRHQPQLDTPRRAATHRSRSEPAR